MGGVLFGKFDLQEIYFQLDGPESRVAFAAFCGTFWCPFGGASNRYWLLAIVRLLMEIKRNQTYTGRAMPFRGDVSDLKMHGIDLRLRVSSSHQHIFRSTARKRLGSLIREDPWSAAF